MITPFEEFLYNEHLKSLRTSKNQPYKLRKDFSNISPESVILLKRISRLLIKLSHIKPVDFFKAPFHLYPGDHFDLKFFTTQKALKSYTTYMKSVEDSNPDTAPILEQTKEALLFVQQFLQDNNLTVETYCLHKTNSLPTFLIHLKDRCINFYTVYALPNAEAELKKQDKDILKFMFDESFYDRYSTYLTRFLHSKKCKLFVREGLNTIQLKITKKQLETPTR